MGFEVYDCRRDIRNILVRPQIRARFCRLEPGTGSLDFDDQGKQRLRLSDLTRPILKNQGNDR